MALFDANKIYGLANKNSKLKEGDVIEIRRLLFKTEETYRKIGKKFNVSAACVMQIAKGRTWKWLKHLE